MQGQDAKIAALSEQGERETGEGSALQCRRLLAREVVRCVDRLGRTLQSPTNGLLTSAMKTSD